MPLKKKLLLFMVVPALLLGMMGSIGLYSLRHLKQAAGRILSDNYRSIQEARRMTRLLHALESASGPDSGAAGSACAAEEAAIGFEEALRACEGNVTEAGEAGILARIRSGWEAIRPGFVDGSGAQRDPRRREALRSISGDIEDLVALNENGMVAYERETRLVARSMQAAVAVSALAAFAALALFATIAASRISRPLAEVAGSLHSALNPKALESGPREPGTSDEIAQLKEALDALLTRLSLYEDEQTRKLSHVQGRLAFVMNEVLEGLVLMDANKRVLAANRVGRTILGMPADDGYPAGEPKPREDVRKLLSPVMEGTFQPEHDLGEVRFEIDGGERIFRPRILTVPASGGGIEGYLVMFWDVTEQHGFEESRRRFISMLSHQLKTPMTSLTMSVNLIREKIGCATPAQAELISIAVENCNHLSALVSELIDAARGSTADLAVKPRRMDLPRLLRSALRPLAPQSAEKGVELVVPPEEPSIMASVDPVKFPWVVTNIAGNALRYTARGGRIEVTVSSAGGRVEVSVKDTGAGIERENLDRIFQAYVSLDPEPRPGTHGLGLAIAKEIVEAHGGVIEASSEPGKGTRFLINLPA